MKKRTKFLAVVVATVMAAPDVEKKKIPAMKNTRLVLFFTEKMMHSVRQNMRTLILRRKHWMLISSGH